MIEINGFVSPEAEQMCMITGMAMVKRANKKLGFRNFISVRSCNKFRKISENFYQCFL